MPIYDDFTIDYVNKRIYHSSGSAYYTVNQLYSWLMDVFDEPEQMDDPIPMSAQTPTEYTLINGWFVDDVSFRYLYGGAIKTDGHNGEIQILTLQSSGYTNAVASDIGKTVRDDGVDTGPLLAYDNALRKWWIRYNATIASGSVMTIYNGTGAGTASANSATGENLWANIYTLGSIMEDDNQQIYIEQNGARIFQGSEWWPGSVPSTRHIDVLIKVREAGIEIAEGVITVFLRHYPSTLPGRGTADLYDHFSIDLSAGGRNAVPLATSPDLNNTTAPGTVDTWTDITIAFVNGTINYSTISGAFTELETVTGGTSGATALFIAQSSLSGSGTMTLANIQGTFQSGETITGGTSGRTATTSSTVTGAYKTLKAFPQQSAYNYSVIIDCNQRPLAQVYQYLKAKTRIGSTYTMYPTTTNAGGTTTWTTQQGQLYIRAHEDARGTSYQFAPVKASPFGTFAGGTFFGAQGIWVQNMASSDIQSFQLIDSDGNTRNPPNQQTITISNLVSGDAVAVFRTVSGTTIDKEMYTSGSGNNQNNTEFIVTSTITSDTPTSGIIRIVDVSDTSSTRERRHTYTGWTNSPVSKFTGLSPSLDRDYTANEDKAYVPFIDTIATGSSVSTTVIYSTDRSILVRVRRKTSPAILPFETTGTFGSRGYTATCIRTPDNIVT